MDRRPGIFRVGTVELVGEQLHVAGWGLRICETGCRCHVDPVTYQLSVAHSDTGLGLKCWRPEGCDCCTPWAPEELAQIVRDLADIAALACCDDRPDRRA